MLVGVQLVPAALAARPTPRLRRIDAGVIAWRLAHGKPVVERGVEIHGKLRLPPQVEAPFSIRDSRFLGDLVATSRAFHSLVDLSGSTFAGSLDFSDARFEDPLQLAGVKTAVDQPTRFSFADFDGPAVFDAARFRGPASFAGAQFHAESSFERAKFNKSAGFAYAAFDHSADFNGATFIGAASFARDEFNSPSDFGGAQFGGRARFDSARFAGTADFSGATFMPDSAKAGPASFRQAHFAGGGVFPQATFAGGASFDAADASGVMDFEGATFAGSTSFSTIRFQAEADFAGAEFDGLLDFDQAQLTALDLDHAILTQSHVFLPAQSQGSGHLDSLRMDPADVKYVSVGTGSEPRQAREHALALIETLARSGGDLRVAAQAGVRRRTLVRHGETAPLRILDWLFYWGIAGYFLRPWHPFWALVGLLLFGAIVHEFARHRARLRRSRPRNSSSSTSSTASPPAPAANKSWPQRAEGIAQKLLVAVLLLAIGNVWPPVAELLKGVLP